MNCYLCDQSAPVGTLRYGIQPAVGVRRLCGIGVCRAHSRKVAALGALLLCEDYAKLSTGTLITPSVTVRTPSKI